MSLRLHALLLRFYPASFRDSYGNGIQEIFRGSLHRAHGWALLLLWIRAIADVIINAPAAHAELLWQDLKYTRRTLSRSPGFALAVVTITGLAVGAACSVFTLADRVFLHPLPFHQPDRLVRLWEDKPGYTQMELSPPNFRDWQSMNKSFESMAAWRGLALNMTSSHQPVHVEGAAVTANLFGMLGVRPLLGRMFTSEDDLLSSPATLLLSESLWRDQFAADPGVLGRVVFLDNRPHIVIGIMRRTFQFPNRIARFWTPMRFEAADFADRANNYLHALGRLRPGVTVQQARSDLRSIASNLEKAYPLQNEKTSATLIPLAENMDPRSRLLLFVLCGASLCFLLIACLNLAGLFVARALARRKELSIRTALGAGPDRLLRQLATESLALALAGGIIGLLVASLALPFLGRLAPESLPIDIPQLDLRAAALAGLLALAASVLFGVMPAKRAVRGDSFDGLREGGRQGVGGRRQGVRTVLVVAEVSLSLALLVSAGLLIRALWNIQAIDPGFRPEGVLTLRTPLPMPKYERTATRSQFYGNVLREIRALPGATSAAYISFLPIAMRGGIWRIEISGQTHNFSENHTASLRFITSGFFSTLRIPLLKGRDVSESDTLQTTPTAVVSQSFANRYWPGDDPLGRTFRIAFADRTVVGVVQDIKVRGLERQSEPQVYLPEAQAADGWLTWYAPKDLVVAVAGDGAPASLTPEIRRIIERIDPEQPVTNVQLLSDVVASDAAARRLQVRLLGAFAAAALLLAAVGLYSLLSYTVSQRTQEFGVRMALGARAWDIFSLVLKQSFWLTASGLLVGAALAAIAGRELRALLYGVPAWDSVTWAAAILLCISATMLGSLLPAARAARADAMESIRRE